MQQAARHMQQVLAVCVLIHVAGGSWHCRPCCVGAPRFGGSQTQGWCQQVMQLRDHETQAVVDVRSRYDASNCLIVIHVQLT
jgi:hypothetical protein